VDGEYQILVRATRTHADASSHYVCGDCAVEVDARFASEAQAWLGIAFDIIGNYETYYFFRVSASQYYSLFRWTGDDWDRVIPWTSSDHINPGPESNRLRLERHGTDIAMYVNGHHLETVYGSISTGSREVGVTASAYLEPNVEARFDNFAVYGVNVLAERDDRFPGLSTGVEER
jgi:hypothetical protein